MKITLLLAQCTSETLKYSLDIIQKVLKELDVEVHKIDLTKLPYFEGKKGKEIERIMQTIERSKGVIAMTMVPMLGMHGAMQSFFDTATLYEGHYFNKPLLAITYSEWLGEQEVANSMLRCWNILGGNDGGKLFLNKQTDLTQVQGHLEREVEDFYRLIKQERLVIKSSEHIIFQRMKSNNNPTLKSTQGNQMSEMDMDKTGEIRSFADIIRGERIQEEPKTVIEPTINLSTKEQTIKEIASLIQREAQEDGFKEFNTGIYTRPPHILGGNTSSRKLQQIPHYFIAQFDKELALALKYHVTDSNEEGYIIIKEGDCLYKEKLDEAPTVELIFTEEVLESILSKKITYQKAFMLGKLKVKGNFAILPKLDQIFKAL